MNIVHYFRRMRFEDGGPVRAVIDLTDRLAGAGNAVRLVTTDDADVPPDRPRTHGAEPFGSPGRPVRVFPIDGATSVAGFLKTPALQTAGRILEGADILHLHGAWDTSNLQFAKMARRMGIPYIVSPRGMLDDWCMAQRPLKKRVYHALVGKRFFEGAAGVHCTAEAELAQSKKWFPRGRGFVVPNLLDLTPYHDLPDVQVARDAFPDLKTEDAVLLFLSRIHEKKGIELLIRATRVLKDRGMRVRTLIAGTGDKAYTESLQRLASTEGVSDRVKFLGMVGGEAKLALYRDADLFVLPTSQENFGFVLPESLACGTAVITTKGVDIWPELEQGGGARIIEPNVGDLAAAISELLSDPGALKMMGERGRESVFDWLDTDRVVGQFMAMYEQARVAPS